MWSSRRWPTICRIEQSDEVRACLRVSRFAVDHGARRVPSNTPGAVAPGSVGRRPTTRGRHPCSTLSPQGHAPRDIPFGSTEPARVAQGREQRPPIRQAAGSNPAAGPPSTACTRWVDKAAVFGDAGLADATAEEISFIRQNLEMAVVGSLAWTRRALR